MRVRDTLNARLHWHTLRMYNLIEPLPVKNNQRTEHKVTELIKQSKSLLTAPFNQISSQFLYTFQVLTSIRNIMPI